jgi:hypothetical protein
VSCENTRQKAQVVKTGEWLIVGGIALVVLAAWRREPGYWWLSPSDVLVSAAVVDRARSNMREQGYVYAESAGHNRLVRAYRRTWSSSALGCPRPDLAYMDMIIPGYMMVFKYYPYSFPLIADRPGGYHIDPYHIFVYYHSDLNGDGIVCQPPEPPPWDGIMALES